jgi:hypothetical protein
MVTTTVLAAIPDQAGRIHACYTASATRIIDSANQSCSSGETSISWGQHGPLLKNLAGIDLSGSTMMYWDLKALDFTNTNFQGAILRGSDLRNSIIVGANFSGANLANANISNLNMNAFDLTGLVLNLGTKASGTTFVGVYTECQFEWKQFIWHKSHRHRSATWGL